MTYKDLIKDKQSKKSGVHEVTLAEAQAMILANRDKGIVCPCCGRKSTVYSVIFNHSIALSLFWLVKRWEITMKWINPQLEAPRKIVADRKWPKLAHWGLAEAKEGAEIGRKVSGLWRPTGNGIEVVYQRRSIPQRVYVWYSSQILGFSKEKIYINDAFDEHFNYDAMLREEVPLDIILKRINAIKRRTRRAPDES